MTNLGEKTKIKLALFMDGPIRMLSFMDELLFLEWLFSHYFFIENKWLIRAKKLEIEVTSDMDDPIEIMSQMDDQYLSNDSWFLFSQLFL